MTAAVALCAERLAAGDRDRFAAVMAAPASLRPGLFALYATNLEIARAPWASAEPLVAEMRLQWWVDALAARAAHGQAVPHDIGPALEALSLPVLEVLCAVAEARRADCWGDPFADEAALWTYLEATAGGLFCAAGQVAGGGMVPELRAYGATVGMANWLVAQPELARRGRLCLAGGDPVRLGRLAQEALERLDVSERALRRASQAIRFAALPGWQARGVLARAGRDPSRIADGHLRGPEIVRRFGLLRARLAI